jgi:hypothetical protein
MERGVALVPMGVGAGNLDGSVARWPASLGRSGAGTLPGCVDLTDGRSHRRLRRCQWPDVQS